MLQAVFWSRFFTGTLYVHSCSIQIQLFLNSRRNRVSAIVTILLLLLCTSLACAAKVLIIGDTQYAVVADVAYEVHKYLKTPSTEYATEDVKGRLASVVEHEDARIVVALGLDAVNEAMHLPPHIAVVYGLVVVPPKSLRENLTCVYMSAPVSEYVGIIRRYLPGLARFSVVGSQNMLKSLLGGESTEVASYKVGSTHELLTTINRLADRKAILLLPDANLLTAAVMSNIFLFSFRNNIPLLGISEAHVKQGSLFALVFDAKAVSRQIAEKVQNILNGSGGDALPATPPGKYNLYINSNTARKMGIEIPDELLKRAKKVF